MNFISFQCNAFVPLFLYLISDYLRNENFSYAKSVMFLVLIFGLKFIKVYLAMHSEFILRKIGIKIFSCICFSMTQKALAGGKKTAKSLSISEISKLAQYDCSKDHRIPYPRGSCLPLILHLLFFGGVLTSRDGRALSAASSCSACRSCGTRW
jgi:hypothetical protein